MIIFIYGSDGYRLKENINTVVGAYRKKYKSGMGYHHFDLGDSSDFDELANAAKSVSFFNEAKLIIVKNSFSAGPVFLHKFVALSNDLNITGDKKTVLVFVGRGTQSELQKTDKDLFSFLNGKSNLIKDISYLEGNKLANWVRNKFKENGHNVSLAVAGLLVATVGKESWALANEVEKLSNYKSGGVITEKDIELLVSCKGANSIFDLVDAVGSQNKAKAFEMMYRLTNSGHDPHYLLSMLFYHFENLLSVADLMEENKLLPVQLIAKKCGLHPFVARKAAGQAKKFSKKDLVEKFNYLAGLDIASKNGRINLEDALYNFTTS